MSRAFLHPGDRGRSRAAGAGSRAVALRNLPRPGASAGHALDPAMRRIMEGRFGHDFSRVRIHDDGQAARSAAAERARAYTIGSDVVFAAGRYQPDSAAGQGLLAHELTHVVQQSGGSGRASPAALEAEARDAAAGRLHRPITRTGELALMRAEEPEQPAPARRKPDIRRIAELVHDGIEGLGTDEEKVYGALQQLDRDPDAISALKAAYAAQYKVSLLDDIRDDFSDEELEFALQLLNEGTAGSAQRIEPTPAGPSNVVNAAERIREAVEGPGTDEEAIFAVLLPFKGRTLPLQNAYQERYGEDLRDRLVDELEEDKDELDYALSLFESPYEHYLQEANRRLAGAPFGLFGDITVACGPVERQMSSGVDRTYWWDRDWWDSAGDVETKSCKVVLLPGKSAAAAIDAMFDHQDRWKIACAEFVQIAHLYALRHVLGAKRFDETVAGDKFTLEIKRRRSTGLKTQVEFTRAGPYDPMVRSDSRKADPREPDMILYMAPIGSRVRWTNLDPKAEGTAWQNENTIKLGPDNYGAHGTAMGIISKDNTHSRAEIEEKVARATNPDADPAYIAGKIFISEVEIFETPAGEP